MWIYRRADAVIGKQHGDLFPVHCQCGCNFRPDEAPANHGNIRVLLADLRQFLVISNCPVIEDLTFAKWQSAGSTARSQQDSFSAILVSLVILAGEIVRVKRNDLAPQVKAGVHVIHFQPDAVERFTLPQALAERRAFIGWVRFHPHQSDGPLRIDLPYAAHGSSRAHPTADNEILIVFHGTPLLSRFHFRGNHTALYRNLWNLACGPTYPWTSRINSLLSFNQVMGFMARLI